MITLLEKHSNVANEVYEFIADSKSDLTNFETDVKTLLHGKMRGTHSKCFVIETGTWFYYGADGTLTEAADGSIKVDTTVTKNSANAVSGDGVYNTIQALFTYDEATKIVNITPIDGGS